MAHFFATKKSKQTFALSVISLIAIILLIRAVDLQDAIRIFRSGVSLGSLLFFSVIAFFIALIYGYRWHLLLDRQIKHRMSLVASFLSLGGNMFLPARGGDLLRVHYSHVTSGMSHAEVLSKLILEKIIDLVSIALVGILAMALLNKHDPTDHKFLLTTIISSALAGIFLMVIVIRYFSERVLSWGTHVFRIIGLSVFFDRYIVRLISEMRRDLSVAIILRPGLITLAMWLTASTASYILIARFVGVYLSYPESLFVVFAGAMGLMLPAAPSGIGTFHASVTSAFILLGRSPTEGLLVATAIHLFYFIAYALPAVIIYWCWRHRTKPENHYGGSALKEPS